MKFTVIANCQSGPVASLFSAMVPDATFERLKQIHLLSANDKIEFDLTLTKVDLIIHQPIGQSFGFFSIDNIKSRFPDKIYVSFPSLFFLGYWPWMMYLRKPNGGALKGVLGDYHDERVVAAYIDGLTPVEATERVLCTQIPSDFMIKEIEKLSRREVNLDSSSVDYIERYYQTSKLFYTMNHPSNQLMIHVVRQIVGILGLNLDKDAQMRLDARSEFLSTIVAPIDRVVRNAFQIDAIDDGCFSCVSDGVRSLWTMEEYISRSFEVYATVPNLSDIFTYAKERRNALGN